MYLFVAARNSAFGRAQAVRLQSFLRLMVTGHIASTAAFVFRDARLVPRQARLTPMCRTPLFTARRFVLIRWLLASVYGTMGASMVWSILTGKEKSISSVLARSSCLAMPSKHRDFFSILL